MAAVTGSATTLDRMPTAESTAVAGRLAEVRGRIARRGVDPAGVRVVAVTKGFGPESVEAALRAGLRDVGENYAQELAAKAAAVQEDAVPEGARWHFLGAVQRNKVRRIAPLVTAWHGVDRPAAADAIAAASPGAEVLVEVNVAADPGRPGCSAGDLDELVAHCRGLPLDLSGLMAVAPAGDPELARNCFRWLADSARRLGLRELSMGMSDDFELAVEEGATTVRLGRVLFGPRPGAAAVQR